MREAVVILFAIALLAALTAVKYRRQIVTLIHFYKQLQAIRQGISGKNERVVREGPKEGIQLIRCERCSKWVPQSNSIVVGGKMFCKNNCRVAA